MRREGDNVIEFSAFKPNVTAPTTVVDQVLGFYRIGSLVQVTFGCSASVGSGAVETIQACNLLWEPRKLLVARQMISWAITEWRDGTFKEVTPDIVGSRRPFTQ